MLVKCKFIKLEANYWEINSKDKKIHAAAKNRNKIEAIRKIVNEHDNIIFVSSFKDVANQFAYELKNIQAIDGDSKIEERDEVVKNFNDKFIKIIITKIFKNLPIVDISALRGSIRKNDISYIKKSIAP